MSPLVIDICCAAIVFVSLLIGYFRGFIRSLLSVVSWVVAAWATWQYAHLMTPYLTQFHLDPALQIIAANLILFFVVLLLAAIVSAIIARLIVLDSISGIDRTMGAAFGIARGVAIVLILAIVGSFAIVWDAPWWQESIALSLLEPYVHSVRDMVSPYLSPDLMTS